MQVPRRPEHVRVHVHVHAVRAPPHHRARRRSSSSAAGSATSAPPARCAHAGTLLPKFIILNAKFMILNAKFMIFNTNSDTSFHGRRFFASRDSDTTLKHTQWLPGSQSCSTSPSWSSRRTRARARRRRPARGATSAPWMLSGCCGLRHRVAAHRRERHQPHRVPRQQPLHEGQCLRVVAAGVEGVGAADRLRLPAPALAQAFRRGLDPRCHSSRLLPRSV